jgi:hypothetical protein
MGELQDGPPAVLRPGIEADRLPELLVAHHHVVEVVHVALDHDQMGSEPRGERFHDRGILVRAVAGDAEVQHFDVGAGQPHGETLLQESRPALIRVHPLGAGKRVSRRQDPQSRAALPFVEFGSRIAERVRADDVVIALPPEPGLA